MAAALILHVGGGQFSAAASKSGLWLSPGRLAAGGVRAAFKGQPPSNRAAPQIGEASRASGPRCVPARSLSALEQNASCAPIPRSGKAANGQRKGQVACPLAPRASEGFWDFGSFILKRPRLEFLSLEPSVFAIGLGLMHKKMTFR